MRFFAGRFFLVDPPEPDREQSAENKAQKRRCRQPRREERIDAIETMTGLDDPDKREIGKKDTEEGNNDDRKDKTEEFRDSRNETTDSNCKAVASGSGLHRHEQIENYEGNRGRKKKNCHRTPPARLLTPKANQSNGASLKRPCVT
ncbi:hypothetical protein [Roseibium sp. MMSF_3412]|uniref:hypothetical protein n=1 Tax=Roseibium sp. MMSF_3412 TaxID=3046712 RepID=UPI00273FD9C5|nr:hypothetical protein [Roseibium sp. MMSF_3412]